MSDWRKRGKKTDEVIYFPGSDEETLASARQAYVWDLDKTYLDTQMGTFKELWKTATEKANQKKNIPGTAELVTSLKVSWTERHQADTMKAKNFPLFFITASPPQLEEKISKKFEIDGIKPFGVFCKDNLPNLRPRRFKRLSKHVGYKLQALLQMRSYLADDVSLYLFGDDGESDSIIYALFSDLCARRMNSEEFRKILTHFDVLDEQVDQLLRLQELVPKNDPVKKVYINLAEDTDADYYLKFGRRFLPTYNSFQMAIDLFQEGHITAQSASQVGQALQSRYGYTIEQLDWSFNDLIRRQRLSTEAMIELLPGLTNAGVLSIDFAPQIAPRSKVEIDGSFDPWLIERIEYLNDYR
jgi:hypothetical protein